MVITENCSKKAENVAHTLKGINYLLGNNFWTEDEISSVSKKISCNFFKEFPEIVKIAVLNPLNRRETLEMNYTINGIESILSYKLTGVPGVNTINIQSLVVKPNKDQKIEKQQFLERIHILNLEPQMNKGDLSPHQMEQMVQTNKAENSVIAESIYYDDSTTNVSTVDYAYYTVTAGSGVFDQAKRVRIDFNKDKTRKVSVIF